jgi:hypothetical protein
VSKFPPSQESCWRTPRATASLGIAKEICAAAAANPQQPDMTAPDFETAVVEWARSQPDIEALVQIGSRVQPAATVDAWSDWDYQLITRNPKRYQNRNWPAQIAPCWSAYFERTERGVIKLSAVFAGGFEADFVLLSSWQIRLVCRAMRYPGLQTSLPSAVRRGVYNLRLIAGPGYRVILGGAAWERRYGIVANARAQHVFSGEDFQHHVAGFWRHAVWVAKKTLRGELRAALRWSQVELREHTYALLAEEARLEGREPRPEARQAETWLSPVRLNQTARAVAYNGSSLASFLLEEMNLFSDVSRNVASRHGFSMPDNSAVEKWLRDELSRVAT